MSPKTTLFLMLATIAIGSAAFYSHFYERERRDEQERKDKKIFLLEDKKLQSIKITESNSITQLECANSEGCPFNGTGEWKIESPVKALGDSSSIGSLASSILNLQLNDKIEFEGEINSNEFGFGSFQLEIKLMGQEQPIVVTFGEASPVTSDIYLQTSTQPKTVYLVPSFLKEQLKKDLFHWQNKKIIPEMKSDSIQKISWIGKVSFSFEQSDGEWLITKPAKLLANVEMIDGLANGIALLEAKKIQINQAASLKNKKPDLKIILTSDEKKSASLSFFIVPKTSEVLVINEESKDLFSIEKSFLERFEKPIDEYRSRKLVSAKNFSLLDKVVFTFPKEKSEAVFDYKDSKWHFNGTTADEFSLERVENIINQLIESDIKSFHKIGASEYKVLETPDLIIDGYSKDSKLFSREFTVFKNTELISKGELSNEVLRFTEAFSRVYPVRLTDLYKKNNKTVIHSDEVEEKKEDHSHHGHNH
ncbi:MAG: DUF4340 domain-containing protein [Oligoflexia bacterium]|nr:DUF4340 domain-containing protein [Oligoflexia bacterium]